jgi:hypothetical protein
MILVGKSGGKGPLERPRRRFDDDNIKMSLRKGETVWTGHGSAEGFCECCDEPSGSYPWIVS